MKSLNYFLMGMGAGAALAALYTPESGDETRSFIKTKAQDGAAYAQRTINDGADYVMQQANDLKTNAVDTLARAKDAVTTPLENLSAAVDAGTGAYKESLRKSTPVKA